jgi:hypothetical protein
VFENTVLRIIFWPKRDEIARKWGNLHEEKLNNFRTSRNIVRVIESISRWAENVARMGESRCVYRVLVEKSEGNRPLGRPSRRWKDNIKMDLHEVGCEGMD